MTRTRPMASQTAPLSNTYCTYNGFMLGQFMHQCEQLYTEPHYEALRCRIIEFLGEVDIQLQLPTNHSDYRESSKVSSTIEYVSNALDAVSEQLGFCFTLGLMATEFFKARLLETDLSGEMVNDFLGWSGDCGVTEDAIHRIVSDSSRRRGHEALSPVEMFNEGLCMSLSYVAELLSAAEPDSHTAFVAMPFDPPYSERYSTFYLPLLARFGYRGLRAWGSILDETYSVMMIKLIERCSVVLADLSTMNQNVLYEVGVAHGQDKETILLTDSTSLDVPSNISKFLIFRYDPSGQEWELDTIGETALAFAAARAAVADRAE